MCWSVLNGSGDLVTSAVVARSAEGWNGSAVALDRDR